MNLVRPEDVKPLNVFIIGDAGVGKSRLIGTCYAFLTKTFNSSNGCPEKVSPVKFFS